MTAASASFEIVTFEVAGRRGAFLVSDVIEVVRAVTITPLPGAPRVIEGVIDLRGKIVPVIDLRARFDLPTREVLLSDRLIVVRVDARAVAARVDDASPVVRVGPSELEKAAPTEASHIPLAGVAKRQDGLVLIYDAHAFLSAIEAEALDRALAAGAEA